MQAIPWAIAACFTIEMFCAGSYRDVRIAVDSAANVPLTIARYSKSDKTYPAQDPGGSR